MEPIREGGYNFEKINQKKLHPRKYAPTQEERRNQKRHYNDYVMGDDD